MEPLKYCELCFTRGKTNLCETYKNTFTKISPLHFSQQSKLDKILLREDARPRIIERRWTCVIDATKRKDFLDSLWGIGVTIHTLEDHIKVLTKLYSQEIKKLGKLEKIELPNFESWEEFNPKSRNWDLIKVDKKNDKFFGQAKLGNILKCSSFEGVSYFRIYSKENMPALVPVEKRAAHNIMATLTEHTTVYWKVDATKEHGFVETKPLRNIPDDIFNILQRLGVTDKRIPEMIIFENDDYDIINTILVCIKIKLEKSAETINSVLDKNSDMPLTIESIDNERLQVLLDIIKEIGGKIEVQKDHFTISGKHGSVKLTFADNDKSIQSGLEIKISISALEDPPRFTEVLSMIKKRLGLLDLPLESMLTQYWPLITESDLQYVLQMAISWWSHNPVVALNIISKNGKFNKVKEWHSKIKEGKIRSNLDTITLGKMIKQKESSKITK